MRKFPGPWARVAVLLADWRQGGGECQLHQWTRCAVVWCFNRCVVLKWKMHLDLCVSILSGCINCALLDVSVTDPSLARPSTTIKAATSCRVESLVDLVQLQFCLACGWSLIADLTVID